MKTYNITGIFVVFISLYVLSMSVSDYDTIEYRKIPDVIFRQHDDVIENTYIFACVKACVRSLSCLSFAFDNSSQSCYLYNRILYNGVGETVDNNQNGSNVYILNTEDRNIALGKPTAQDSRLYSGYDWLAVDGNYRTSSQNGRRESGWWKITLESVYDIASVIIWNNIKNQYRLANFHLQLSTNSPTTQTYKTAILCYVNDGTTKQVYTVVECNQPSVSMKNVTGFFISLEGNRLGLAEVEVLVI